MLSRVNSTIEIRSSTSGLVELRKEATSSLEDAELIRDAIREGRLRVRHEPKISLDEETKRQCRTDWPEPLRYTSQRFVKEWCETRKKERGIEQIRNLPESYEKLGVNLFTRKAIRANHGTITKDIIQHRTGHGDFEPYQIRFGLEGVPICRWDNMVLTNTHYLTCTRGQNGEFYDPAIDLFSVKRRKKFEKEAKARKKPVWDVIHTWYMTRGVTKFIEVRKEKGGGNNVSWITAEEFSALEDASPEPN